MINGASKREREQPVGSQRWDEVLQHAFVGKQVDATKPWIDQNQVIMPSDGPSAFTKEERLIQTLALKSLCCWGGDYFNVGEGYISELLMRSSSSLEMVIFNPSATKGGILVRPLYSNSARFRMEDTKSGNACCLCSFQLLVTMASAGVAGPARGQLSSVGENCDL